MVSKKVCAVSNCKVYGMTSPSTISFHKFPKDLNICQKLIELAQNKKIIKLLETCGPLHLTKSYSICSIHFTKDDYIANAGRPMLRYGSIPSVNLPSTAFLKSTVISYGPSLKTVSTFKKTPTKCSPSTCLKNLNLLVIVQRDKQQIFLQWITKYITQQH